MASEIAAAHALTRKEKRANKDTVQKKASAHEDKAIAALAGLLGDRKAPATAKARAADILLDRIAGKAAKPEDERRAEDEMTRMSEGALIAMICDNIASLSPQARGAIAEALLIAERGLKLDAERMARDLDAELMEEAERVQSLRPLTLAPKPKREPRR